MPRRTLLPLRPGAAARSPVPSRHAAPRGGDVQVPGPVPPQGLKQASTQVLELKNAAVGPAASGAPSEGLFEIGMRKTN